MRNPLAWLLLILLLAAPQAVQAAASPNLSEGASGQHVTELQHVLQSQGYFRLEPTGYFGSITREALQQWQSDHARPITGSLSSEDAALLFSAENASSPLLYEGLTSQSVTALQNKLRQLGYFGQESTGYFGSITKNALISWQRDQGLAVTGSLSHREWTMLGLDSVSASISYTYDELDLLARLVEAEAGAENYTGKLAVAAVVVNRLKNDQYANSLSGVIHDRGQFEPVMNGYIWRVTPSQESQRAAQAALHGEDPTGGALFFHNPSLSTSGWMLQRPYALRIGNHVFS